ncbi:UPF0598 protein C8orf82 -like protein [Sarcoptes scabiei]|uniref:UPF0598 protein C8orf82 -like protein n=1 Tax=Sarcoptes scabiei TaxID=52283 RepID=A0A132A2T2_SARSC|nr:UPF0598 protein C8orf82 -like protein [Sarcoptes scabiei]KPM05139.1 UPF0598 protein C8orf82-like protein [Sarcoptes scabiei]
MIALRLVKNLLKLNLNNLNVVSFCNHSTVVLYEQGQKDPEKPKIREYFYYIDHHGMLFLDDSRMKNFTSCFKEKQFLNFFFKNIRPNKTGRYQNEFPWISLCGVERNFIRCDDVPIVFTSFSPVSSQDSGEDLAQNHKLVIAYSDLTYPFVPESLFMLPERTENSDEDDEIAKHGGRIYHKADQKFGSYGLIRSQLAQEIDNCFVFDNNRRPIAFRWQDKEFRLSNELELIFQKCK